MHKDWLDNEYRLFIEALESSTVDNFKSHPMVKRMLGEVERDLYPIVKELFFDNRRLDVAIPCIAIDTIGRPVDSEITGSLFRFIHYAIKLLEKKPSAICEIGGGCGQFYATLRALGYNGDYFIYDLPEVQKFQRKYLDEVTKQTGLNTELKETGFDFCVSLYALGEFDDETKGWYVENVVKKCPHGLIVWNPHSGASDEITWECKVEPENPLTAPNNKLCVW